MNIRIRAALEVAAGTVAFFGIAYLIQSGLEALLAAYGMNGVLILLGVAVVGFFMNLVYQIRVSQLKYTEKLKETVNDLRG